MSIEFNKCTVGGVDYLAVTIGNDTKALLGTDGNSLRTLNYRVLSNEEVSAILAKMKELQSPNKDIEFLQADIASLGHLLDMSIERNDPIGKIQLSSRLETRKRELKELQSEVKDGSR